MNLTLTISLVGQHPVTVTLDPTRATVTVDLADVTPARSGVAAPDRGGRAGTASAGAARRRNASAGRGRVSDDEILAQIRAAGSVPSARRIKATFGVGQVRAARLHAAAASQTDPDQHDTA